MKNFEPDLTGKGQNTSGNRKTGSYGSPSERSENQQARDKGLYYLQFSSKTENEMRKKLEEQGFSDEAVEDAILFLKRYRYLDDEAYASRYLERNRKKKSVRQMKYELRQKGIADKIIEAVLEEEPVDEVSQVLYWLEKKKYSGDETQREERQKLSAFLARKGFSYDAIASAMLHYVRKEADCKHYT
ncbi:MAG: regulatory protein RecX [Lachnospiraceae bacterium]|jgi:regulatory protein|nr:regulatory protein RecX [Lachnospiraceae bacterium]NBJ83514.1 regulatory protein RecX [bacterium 1XD42-76]NBK06760.1 regulatory protein RecX [bacterium 1XD42-94]